ncbi:MAG: exosome complex protein Rrp4 [Aigarchaeota archaeon]|nr:exosome complex protein Rrp4 [Aigarchaeota archaeon]MDW7987029.1 exosome complex protein Rrp4 [Nitrososphaerota archaeon]
MPLYFSEREIVLPGQLLSDNGNRGGEGTYVLGGMVYASRLGFATLRNNKVHVIAFKGAYIPQPGDRVIGIVIDVKPNGFDISLGRHLTATIRIPDKKEVQALNLKIGDVIYANVRESGLRGVYIDHTGRIKKITSGLLVSMHPLKIPRLIGKRGSMINMIKKESGCELIVGRNGLIVIDGPSPANEFAALSAIRMIDREAHSQGLTERIRILIKNILEGEKSVEG